MFTEALGVLEQIKSELEEGEGVTPTRGVSGKNFFIMVKPPGMKSFVSTTIPHTSMTAGDRTLKGAKMMVKNTFQKMKHGKSLQYRIVDKAGKVVWEI